MLMDALRDYFRELTTRLGSGWNRFWFTPADALTLSVLRVLTGLVALYLHLTLFADLVHFFGAGGLLPEATVRDLIGDRKTYSYLFHFTRPADLVLVHSIGAVVLALFTAGVYTRITSVLALAVMLSTVHRGPMISTEVEPIVTMVMFYLCLGPSGAYLSVDRLLGRRKLAARRMLDPGAADRSPATWSANLATRLIQVHLAAIYLFVSLAMLSGITWWDGGAVWWLVARTETRLADLTWLADHPLVVNAWTHAIVLVEFAFPLLVWNTLARPLVLGIAAVMWLTLIPITGLTDYCLMMLVANLAFVSPAAMHRVADACRGRLAKGSAQPQTQPAASDA